MSNLQYPYEPSFDDEVPFLFSERRDGKETSPVLLRNAPRLPALFVLLPRVAGSLTVPLFILFQSPWSSLEICLVPLEGCCQGCCSCTWLGKTQRRFPRAPALLHPLRHVPSAAARSPLRGDRANAARGGEETKCCFSVPGWDSSRFLNPLQFQRPISVRGIFRGHRPAIDFERNCSSGAGTSAPKEPQNQLFAGFLFLCFLSFWLKAFLFSASLMKLAFVRGYGNMLLCKNFRVICFKKSQFRLCWWESGSDLNPFCSEAFHLLFLNLKMVWILLKLIWLSCQRKRLFHNAPYNFGEWDIKKKLGEACSLPILSNL